MPHDVLSRGNGVKRLIVGLMPLFDPVVFRFPEVQGLVKNGPLAHLKDLTR
jgi:hypothetical protein